MERKADERMLPDRCRPAARTIKCLPLNAPTDFSPYTELEFDPAVQDHCRVRGHHCPARQEPQKAHLNANKLKHIQHTAPTSIGQIARSCKVVVCGDVAVGKTSLINRFGNGVYSSTHRSTIGVDFDIQRFNILAQPYVLQIWDTAGLEMFRCITNAYYRGCQAAILVFDMSSMSSLANIVKWKDDVVAASKTFDQLEVEYNMEASYRVAQGDTAPREPLLFLVGSKCDLSLPEASRAFMREQANKLAALLRAELWFVSAQTGDNVDELFNRIAALSFNRLVLGEIQRIKFEASTLGACLKERLFQQRKESWIQANKIIKITKKKEGDDRRTRCINIQCVIK